MPILLMCKPPSAQETSKPPKPERILDTSQLSELLLIFRYWLHEKIFLRFIITRIFWDENLIIFGEDRKIYAFPNCT